MMLKQCKKNQSMVFQAPFVYEMSSRNRLHSFSRSMSIKSNQTNTIKQSEKRINGGKIMHNNLEILNGVDDDFRVDEESMKSILKGFKVLAVDPILALSSTDTFNGESRLPVEPVSWSPAKVSGDDAITMAMRRRNDTNVLEKMAVRSANIYRRDQGWTEKAVDI